MKNLLIMRHAKSDWGDYTLSDFERPLNKRGIKDAPMMGEQILKKDKHIDLIISSPAKRAASTARCVAQAINYNNNIQFEQSFYSAYVDNILLAVQQVNNQQNTVLIIGHNPTVEDLIFDLLSDKTAIIMPTAAITSIIFEVDQWQDIENNKGKLEWFIKPKDFK